MPDEAGIYIGAKRSEAMAKAMNQLGEAGYRGKWTELRCTRAPMYDRWASRQTEYRRKHGTSEEFVKDELRQTLTR